MTGVTIKCMERVSSSGLMVVAMKVNTSKTRNKAWALSIGQMVENMWVSGLMGNNMDKARSLL